MLLLKKREKGLLIPVLAFEERNPVSFWGWGGAGGLPVLWKTSTQLPVQRAPITLALPGLAEK